MGRLVEFKLPQGGTLAAEVNEPERTGPKPAGVGEASNRARFGLEQAIANVRPFADLLFTQLKGLSSEPTEIGVEFGIKLNAEAGAVIAKTGPEGNCKITLNWKKPNDSNTAVERQQTETNAAIERWVGPLRGTLSEMSHKIESLEKTSFALSVETHRWLAFQSLGVDVSEVRLTRFFPLRVFLSDTHGNAIADISSAIDKLLEAFDFEVSDDFPAVHGSWFKKWFAKTRELATQPEMLERLEKIERAVVLKGIGQPQAEIDNKQAEAVARLLKAVEKIPNAAIQAGSILLVKLTASDSPVIQVRTLTQRELIHLENNQRLLSSPADLLEKLSELCQERERTKPAEHNLKQQKARPRRTIGAGDESRQP